MTVTEGQDAGSRGGLEDVLLRFDCFQGRKQGMAGDAGDSDDRREAWFAAYSDKQRASVRSVGQGRKSGVVNERFQTSVAPESKNRVGGNCGFRRGMSMAWRRLRLWEERGKAEGIAGYL
jgi:hypothetical protein